MIPGPDPNPGLALLVAQQPPNPASALMSLGLIVSAFRRRQAIGGWLFFFFWEVAAGCAVTLVYTDWSQYGPHAWRDQFKYMAFLFGAAPRMVMLLIIAAIGVLLMRTRDWSWVVVLRYALIIYSSMGAICVAIDLLYFPDRIALDVGALIFPAVYTIYFYVSSRVRSVFFAAVASS